MAPETLKAKVAVVGAGLSGLAAAHRLLSAGVEDVVVLEAKDRVGGRLLNRAVGPGDQVVEVGGQWCGRDHHALLDLSGQVGVETFDFYSQGEAVFESPSGLVRYVGSTPPIGSAGEDALDRATSLLDQFAARVSPSAPWEAADAYELDCQTLAGWLDQVVADPDARAALEVRMSLGFAMPTERISLLHAISFFASVGGWGPYQGRLAFRFRGGSQSVPLGIATQLGDRICLDMPVRQVDQSSEREVQIDCGRASISASRVIVAMSPADCRPLIFTPDLPPRRRILHSGWQAGSQIKVHAVYDEPFWRDEGLSGSSLSLSRMPHMTFDNTPPDGSPGVLGTLFTIGSGPTQASIAGESASARRESVIRALERRFGQKARQPEQYFEQWWLTTPFTAGCVAPAPPRLLTSAGPALRAPIDRVHWASTETAERWTGWMEGAVNAGHRAADEVLGEL